nr:hypothetical protein [Clostridium sp. AF37-5AT]
MYRTDRQQLLRSCRTVVFVYRLIITVCDDGIPVWVPGISGTPWKGFHQVEKTENKGEKMPRGSPENPVKNMIYWTVCGLHGIIEKGIPGADSAMCPGEKEGQYGWDMTV